MVTGTGPSYRKVVQLLRQRLSATEVEDIADDFGHSVGLGRGLFAGLEGDGLDAKISSLVRRAQQLDKLDELLEVCREWRSDLAEELAPDTPAEATPEIQHNLPRRRGAFLGRSADVARVLEGLASRYPLVSIEGIGGVGKTSLAVQVAYGCIEATQEPRWEYVVWVSAMDKPDQKRWLNDVLNRVAQLMGYPAVSQLPVERLPDKRDVVDKLLRLHRVLVIIDNFETIEDPDLVSWMENIPEPSHVLITTRQRLVQRVWAVQLQGLDEEEALALVRQEAEVSSMPTLLAEADDVLKQLVAVTDGNPRAIEMALGYVRGGSLSLQETVGQLRDAGADVDDVFDYLFRRSWTLLSTHAKDLLCVTPLFVGSITRDALKEVSGLDAYDLKNAINQAALTRLLDVEVPAQQYAVHPMTRAFARRQLADRPEFEQAARQRWSNYYLRFVREHVTRAQPDVRYWNALVSDAMSVIDTEWLSINEVLQWAVAEGQQELLLEFVVLLLHYMDSRLHNLERIDYARRAADAAADLGQPTLEALLRIDALGWTYIEEHHMDEAAREITRGLELARDGRDSSGETDDPDGLLSLGSAWMARLRAEQGHYDEATKLIAGVVDRTGAPPWIRYRVAMAAGDIAFKQGDGRRALKHYEDAVSETERYGGEGHGYQIEPRIGLALIADNQLEAADEKFRALHAHEQLAIGKLYAEYGMALVAMQRGHLEEARQLARTARQELYRRTTSNLLTKLIDELFAKLEENRSGSAAESKD